MASTINPTAGASGPARLLLPRAAQSTKAMAAHVHCLQHVFALAACLPEPTRCWAESTPPYRPIDTSLGTCGLCLIAPAAA